MFRLATILDLAQLKLNPGDLLPSDKGLEYRWGLKHFGYMLALREIQKLASNRRPTVLELNPGLGDILFSRIASIADYIAIDRRDLYESRALAEIIDRRRPSRFVAGQMGQFLRTELADESVDITCSVADARTQVENIDRIIADCARVTRLDGLLVHSLNVNVTQNRLWEEYEAGLGRHDFELREQPQEIDFAQDGLLYETLGVLYRLSQKGPSAKERFLGRSLATISIIAAKKRRCPCAPKVYSFKE